MTRRALSPERLDESPGKKSMTPRITISRSSQFQPSERYAFRPYRPKATILTMASAKKSAEKTNEVRSRILRRSES